ncbi:MAG: tyrosine-type recombinase/integrase [Propionicimonas sp.]
MTTTKRRRRGEGSSYRAHAAKYGCPDPVEVVAKNGKTVRRRPPHDKSCKAPWVYSQSKGMVGGGRKREVVTARTKTERDGKVDKAREASALGVSPTGQTLGQWLDYWIVRVAPKRGKSGLRPRTLRGYQGYIDLYLKPCLGAVPLQDLSADHIEQLHDWMQTLDKSRLEGHHGTGPLSDTTIRQAHTILRAALGDALARRKIVYNPAAVVRAPQADDNPYDHLTLDQAKTVMRGATTERELCRLVTALTLGIRQGEALALRWEDYRADDADQHYLLVLESVQWIDGKLTRTDVKSRASKRRVPIPDRMVPIWEAWRKLATDSYIFPGPAGGPCDPKDDWEAWRDALVRVGVPHIPLQGARGSAASLLADMGVPDWRIAEILGHAHVKVTQQHYLRGEDGPKRAAIDGLIGELLPGVGAQMKITRRSRMTPTPAGT